MKNSILYGILGSGTISLSAFLMGSDPDKIHITPAMQGTFQQALKKVAVAHDTEQPKEPEQKPTEQKRQQKKKLKQSQKKKSTEHAEENNFRAVTLMTEHFYTHVPDIDAWDIIDPNLPANRAEYEKYMKVLTKQKPVQFLNHILADFCVSKVKPYIVSKKKLQQDAKFQTIETHYHTGTHNLPVTILFDPDVNKPVCVGSGAFTFEDGMTKFIHIVAETNSETPTKIFLLKKKRAVDQAKHEIALHTQNKENKKIVARPAQGKDQQSEAIVKDQATE